MTIFNTLNWRRYGILCLLSCAVLAFSGCSDRRSEQLRAEGDTLRSLDRLDAAREAYENAAEANPDNPMAQLGLARCSAAEGKTDEALALFRKAFTMDAAFGEAYLQANVEAIRMLEGVDRIDEALSLSDEFAKQVPKEGGTLRGVILMKMGRSDEAIQALKGLSETYPDSEEIRLNLGAAYFKAGKAQEAETLFRVLADGSPGVSVAAHMGLIDVYRAQGRVKEMVGEFFLLTKARPEDLEIRLGYARSLMIAGEQEKAEVAARAVLEQDPESAWANYIIGFYKVEAGSYDEAKAFLEQAARVLPDEGEIMNLLAYAASGGTAPRKKVAARVGAELSSAVESVTWQGLWKQAALNRLLANRDMYLAEGGDEARETLVLAALFTYQAALAKELADGLPETSQVRGYIDAFLSKDVSVIAAHFEGWKAEKSDTPEARAVAVLRDNALGFAMVSGGSREKGLSVFLFCLERWPDHGVALFNISQVFRRLRQPMIAAQNLQRLIGMYPENIDAHQMHYTALREGRAFDAARRAAEASYTLFPDEKWSHLYLCQAYLDTGEPALALQWLGRATSQFPDDPELQSILGRVLVRVGDCEQATTVLKAISTTAPAILSARSTLLALCRVQDGDWAGAMKIANGLSAANRSPSLALIMAAGLAQAGEQEAARGALVPEGGQGVVAGRYGMMLSAALGGEVPLLKEEEREWAAAMGADQSLLSAYATVVALQLADLNDAAWDFYQEHLGSRDPNVALAQLAFRSLGRGDSIEDAGDLARAVASALPKDSRVWIGLSRVLNSLGDTEGEAEAINKALEVGPRVPEALFRHASQMERAGNVDAAVADYLTLVDVMPDNAAANNNLAYTLLLAGGRDEEALKYAVIASEKLPNDAGVRHTLGLAQMRTGNLEESRTNLERAAQIDPANPTIMFDYGRLLVELGKKEEAQKRIRYALAMSRNAGLDFPQLEEAEALLQTLSE